MGQADIIEFIRTHQGKEFTSGQIAKATGHGSSIEVLKRLRRTPMGLICFREKATKGKPVFLYKFSRNFNLKYRQCFTCFHAGRNKNLPPCDDCHNADKFTDIPESNKEGHTKPLTPGSSHDRQRLTKPLGGK